MSYQSAEMPADEAERAAAAQRIDRQALRDDDGLNAIAQQVASRLHVTFAGVSIMHSYEQHLLASVGAPPGLYDRRTSFLSHAIARRYDMFEVTSAGSDDRFAANPWVAGERGAAAYYAAVLMRDQDRYAIGGISVADIKDREPMQADEADILRWAAQAAWERIAHLIRDDRS